MVTKGQILSIDRIANTCTVRLPLFENAGNKEKMIATATFSNNPGVYNGYKINDIVYVAFEDGQVDEPVVIGKLYISAVDEQKDNRGSINCVDFSATGSVELPVDTKLSTDNLSTIQGSYGSYKSIANIIQELQSIKMTIDTLPKGSSDNSGSSSGGTGSGGSDIPFETSNVYSTSETIIGSWLNKTLYRKLIIVDYETDKPRANMEFRKELNLASLNIDDLFIDAAHTFQVGSSYTINANSIENGYFACTADTANSKISYTFVPADTVSLHVFTIEYTKK